MADEEAADDERAYAPPPRFDVAIGYWTGEPDEDALARGLGALNHILSNVVAVRCLEGHLHVSGPRAAVDEAEATLQSVAPFSRIRCAERVP